MSVRNLLPPVKVEHMPAAVLVLDHVLDLVRLPARHLEVVANDPSAFSQVLLHSRPQFIVGAGQQVEGNHGGRAQIHLQHVALNDRHLVLKVQLVDAGLALLVQAFVQLHADGIGAEFPRGRDGNAAVAGAHVIDGIPGPDFG